MFVILYNKVFEHYVALFISDYGFSSTVDFLWYLSLKMLVICPLVYWFLTEKRWFRYALLSPIVIFSMQLFNAITNNEMPVDEIEIFQTLHFTVPLLLTLIFLAKAFDNQEKIRIWTEYQYNSIEFSIKKKLAKEQDFIKQSKSKLNDPKISIDSLHNLKDKLTNEINAQKT